MRNLKIVGIVLAALIGLVLLLGLIAPKTVTTEQSAVIDAPPEAVFAAVNNLKSWEHWSPWKESDPTMAVQMGDPSEGEGAYYTWTSEDSGDGKMTIMESHPPRALTSKVEFDGMGYAMAPWTFEPVEQGTKVTWGLESSMPFPMNAMLLFMDMEEQVGEEYSKGLNNLKQYVESQTAEMNPKLGVKESEMPYAYAVGVRKEVKMEEVQKFYQETLPTVFQALQDKGIEMAGQPVGLYYTWDEEKKTSDMMAAIPVKEQVDLGGAFKTVSLPQGKTVMMDFYGPYDKIASAHYSIDGYMKSKQMQVDLPVIEEYVTDPTQEPDPQKWLTKVIYPVKAN